MDLISVIIPVYNTAEYLPRCLDSVLNNTYRYLEVICINDGSTDNSAEILQRYAQQDSRVVIITQENAGVSAARNAGLDSATGEFVAFIDSDDWIKLSCFERLIYVQKKYNADVIACNSVNAYGTTLVDNKQIRDEKLITVSEALHSAPLKRTVWGKMYRRQLIQTIRFDEALTYGEDTTFNLLMYAQNPNLRIIQVSNSLYVYFCRHGSLSQEVPAGKQVQLILWLLDNYKSGQTPYVQKIFLEQACKDALANRYSASIAAEKDVLATYADLIQKCKNELRSDLFSIKERIRFAIFFQVPFLYRFFRIINDPTLLTWEKLVKEKQ